MDPESSGDIQESYASGVQLITLQLIKGRAFYRQEEEFLLR